MLWIATLSGRGPKGLRIQTAEKIEENAEILANATTLPSDPVPTAVGTEYGDSEASTIASRDSDTVLSSYHYYLTIFRERLYSVWPIVDPGRLASRLAAGDKDHEANALAAALSLGVIAQLRLPNSTESEHLVHKSVLLHETKRLQSITDYQKSCTLDSLLTSFFLHIYYANIQKLSAATYLLRETLTTAHMLKLHHPEAYKSLPSEEYELRLRVYWILFVTERTYCAQNEIPPILQPISEFPAFDDRKLGYTSSMSGFPGLARLFTHLKSHYFESSPYAVTLQDEKAKILSTQKKLERDIKCPELGETQRIDFNITRHWIRTLIWQYTITHFPLSGHSEDAAFSAAYPAMIAKDTLALLSTASAGSICAHGYGMELKILRLADSVLDILVCLPSLKYSETAAGWHDALFSLSRVLHTVGGQKSPFLATLQRRMVEINFPINIPQELESPVPNAWVDAPKALLLGPPEVENGPKANANDDLG
ncbi:MAG: hypothetical protein LQ340_002208 [Diploschistes diacapsis]|nr:MAG: hypothetical protein LQ340_002208 [Diploschistes diacapsis]